MLIFLKGYVCACMWFHLHFNGRSSAKSLARLLCALVVLFIWKELLWNRNWCSEYAKENICQQIVLCFIQMIVRLSGFHEFQEMCLQNHQLQRIGFLNHSSGEIFRVFLKTQTLRQQKASLIREYTAISYLKSTINNNRIESKFTATSELPYVKLNRLGNVPIHLIRSFFSVHSDVNI